WVRWGWGKKALPPATVVKKQMTAAEAGPSRVFGPPVILAHLPPPLTLTLLSDVPPVLVSVTTIVTVPPTAMTPPSAGVELFSVKIGRASCRERVQAAWSAAAGAGMPN